MRISTPSKAPRLQLMDMATGNLLPADFLIDEQGHVVETHCGRDAGDHIPIERIELFVARGLASRAPHIGGPLQDWSGR